jgi:hypothetical protein
VFLLFFWFVLIFAMSEFFFFGNIDGVYDALKKRPKKSVVPPSGNIKKRKYSRQKARRTQCSYYWSTSTKKYKNWGLTNLDAAFYASVWLFPMKPPIVRSTWCVQWCNPKYFVQSNCQSVWLVPISDPSSTLFWSRNCGLPRSFDIHCTCQCFFHPQRIN